MKKYKLSEIAEIIPGYAFKSSDFSGGKNVVIKIKDIVPPNINIANADRTDYSPEEKYRIKKGDYVMAMTGATIGKIGKLTNHKNNVFINQRTCKFVVNNLCDKDFLYYVLNHKSFQDFVQKNIDSKLAQPNIGHPTLYKFEYQYPPISEQKQIASILSNIDRKIELNRAINDNLAKMAKQLYDYWFVQFDFPDENGRPYKSSGGAMEWNEKLKREIPKDWSCTELNKWLEIKSGFAFKSETYLSKGTYKVITIKNVQDHYLDTSSCDYIDQIPLGMKEWCKLSVNDRLISLTGNCGRLCVVTEKNLLLNQRVGLLACNGEYLNYAYLLLSSSEFQTVCVNLAKGAAQANLSPVDLCKNMAVLPKLDTLKAFNRHINPIVQNYIQNQVQIANLIKQRDELLPLLMNGQVSLNYHLSKCCKLIEL